MAAAIAAAMMDRTRRQPFGLDRAAGGGGGGAWINRIGTARPDWDVHQTFLRYARGQLSERARPLFDRMADRSGIQHRYSVLRPADEGMSSVDAGGFYTPGQFPSTGARMRRYEQEAPALALRAVQAALGPLPSQQSITHLVVASCTGFTAPGLDQIVADRLGLGPDVQRTLVGFMGCYAAVPALRAASAAVLANPAARVLVITLELCTLHLQETGELDRVLSFLLFGDAAAAALVSAEPGGIRLGRFRSRSIPGTADLITWRIGDQGFDMHLSGRVPPAITAALRAEAARNAPGGLLEGVDAAASQWAVHAGGRTVLDAVAAGLDLPPMALEHSRAVLRDIGNVSSATLMFVLERMLRERSAAPGVALAFGPGLSAESFRFQIAA